MLAALIETPGGTDCIQVREVPTPPVPPGYVLIEVEAIGVGVPDLLIRSGLYRWMPPLPAILGIEASGRICEIGADVDGLEDGTRVYVSARELPARAGCYAEFISVPASAVTILPDAVGFQEAVCLSNYQVAHSLLTYTASMHTQSVLVYGAAGGVGSAVVELAALRNYRVIGVVSSTARRDFAFRMGASATVDRHSSHFPEEVVAASEAGGVDLVLDLAGGKDFCRNFEFLRPFGTVVLYGTLAGGLPAETANTIYSRIGLSPALRLFSMHSLDSSPQVRTAIRSLLVELMGSGKLKSPIHDTLPLARARDAHELLSSGAVMGKLVLVPKER